VKTRKDTKGRLCAALTVMTGRGNHSRHNRSVLKPANIDWAKDKGFDFEQEDDRIIVFIVVG